MNVIVIVADTWRFDYLGCYGNTWIHTPNIDRLAEHSVVFENAYAEGCPTIPTRRALFTGRYTLPFRGWGPLLHEDVTIADILWSERTLTTLITDTAPMHLPGYGYERGFDHVRYLRGQEFDPYYRLDPCSLKIDTFHKPIWDSRYGDQVREINPSYFARRELSDFLPQREKWKSDKDQSVARLCVEAMDYLERVDRTRPFLLWLDSFDPHEPWDPPSVWAPDLKCPYDPDYDGMEIILPVPTYVDGYLTDRECHHIRMLYAEKITMVDKWLGKVLDKIGELGLYDNSLIFFLSDHGQPLGKGEHGHGIIRKCRPWPYEELTHIPLIIHHPEGIRKRVSAFVETVDIAPTIMEFLNVKERIQQMQGKSLLPLIKGEAEALREFSISGYFGFSWSIVTRDWSYIHWLDKKDIDDKEKLKALYGRAEMKSDDSIWTCTPGSVAETPMGNELYDRRNDPYQLNNLIERQPEIARELHVKLRDRLMDLRAT